MTLEPNQKNEGKGVYQLLKVLMKRPCNGWRRLPAAESLQIRQPSCTQQSKDSNFASMKANQDQIFEANSLSKREDEEEEEEKAADWV